MNPLQSRLASLRRHIRSVALVRGLSLVVLALLGSGLLAGWLDWNWHLPPVLRALLLVLALGATLVMAYRFLIAPLVAKVDDLTLALRVEKEYPVLNDALASTVQFLQQPEDSLAGGSPALRREAVQRALRLAQGCDFERVINTRGVRLSSVAATVLGALVILLSLWHPSVVRSAVFRLVHPFGEHDWATLTQLNLDFPKRVAAGQKFQIRGEVTGIIPKHAVISLKGYSLGDHPPREYPITLDKEGKGVFVAKLDLTDQRDDFQFFIEANDARFPKRAERWHTIKVEQPPRLPPYDGVPSPQKVVLAFPAYTDLPSPKSLPPGTKHIDAVEGTWVSMEARADRPLKAAWIRFQPSGEDYPDRRTILDAARLSLIGLANPLQVLATQKVAEQAWARIPVKLDKSGTQLFIHFRPWLSGTHVLHIEDERELSNEYTFNINLLPDPAPIVALEQPGSNRTLLPSAAVNLEITARDEKFGLRSVFLEYWRKDKYGRLITHKIERVPLYDAEMVAAEKAEGVADAEGKPFVVPDPPFQLKPLFLKVKKRWSLEGLVQEGDTLVIRAGADDFNNVVAFNTPGYSHEVELTIVGKTEMNISLDKTQAKVQNKLIRIKDLQKAALDNVQEVAGKVAGAEPLTEEELKKLLDKVQDAEQWQKEIQDLIGKEKQEGLLEELRQLEQVIKDNKIESSDAKDRAKLLKSELKKIAKQLDMINPALNKAKQQLNAMEAAQKPDPKDLQKDLTSAKGGQMQVLKALEELLQHLDRWASLQQIRAEAQALLEEQKKVMLETEKLSEKFNPRDKSWQGKLLPLADQQQQLALDAKRLLDKLNQAHEEKQETDPDIARMLYEALQIGEEMDLPGEMKNTDELIREKKFNLAVGQQGESIKTLKQMIEALSEKREDQLEKLIQHQEQAKGELQEIIERLEKLQKEVEKAQNIADPDERKQALAKLAEQQQKLLEEAQKKTKELARLRAEDAGQDLNKAAKQMEQALQKLQAGDDPLDEQQQALEQSKKAERKLQQAQQEAEEELAREKLAKIADQIIGLKERQDSLITETERLHKMILKGGWLRQLRIEFNEQGKAQTILAEEAVSLAEKLKGAKVFEMVLKKAGQNMETAAKAIDQRWKEIGDREGVFPLPPDILKDEEKKQDTIIKAQKQASERLQSLVDAIKEVQKQQQAKADPDEPDQPDMEPEPQPKGGVKAQDGIPPMAQLQALKAEQLQINERTSALAKQYPDMANLPPEAQAELEAIHADQQALFELFQEITAAIQQGEKQ